MQQAHGIREVISLSLARDSWFLLFGHAHDLTIIKTFFFKTFIKCVLPLMLSEEGCVFHKCHHMKYSIGSSYLVLDVGFLARVPPTPLLNSIVWIIRSSFPSGCINHTHAQESLTTRFALTAADVKKSNFFKLPETYFMLKGSQAL